MAIAILISINFFWDLGNRNVELLHLLSTRKKSKFFSKIDFSVHFSGPNYFSPKFRKIKVLIFEKMY
jgi:hypothetical protein